LHLEAHRQIAAVLKEADVIKSTPAEALASGLSSVFLPHGLGHLLGLQVHDVGGHLGNPEGALRPPPAQHPYLRLTRRLEPGFVVTIEPGVYFIESLLSAARGGKHHDAINWTRIEQLRAYGGIRIEDNVLCTAAEPENLTRPAFAAEMTKGA
jgi:Xaa-Pro dipeptidase